MCLVATALPAYSTYSRYLGPWRGRSPLKSRTTFHLEEIYFMQLCDCIQALNEGCWCHPCDIWGNAWFVCFFFPVLSAVEALLLAIMARLVSSLLLLSAPESLLRGESIVSGRGCCKCSGSLHFCLAMEGSATTLSICFLPCQWWVGSCLVQSQTSWLRPAIREVAE